MHIDDRKIIEFIETAVPKLVDPEVFKTTTEYCPHCHGPIRFPLIARECDIDAFRELLKIGKKYLSDEGITDKILKDLMDMIDKRLNVQ